MGHRDSAGLLRVIVEVGLRIHIRIVSDDLDGVLVRSDRAVRAQSPELTVDRALRSGDEGGAGRKGEVGHIIVDADRESLLLRILEDGDDLVWRRILGAEAVAPGQDLHGGEGASGQSGHHIEIERLSDGTRLLRAVEDADGLHALWKSGEEGLCREGTVESHLHDAELRVLRLLQIINGLLNGVIDGAHRDDDMLRVRRAVVIEKLIVRADLRVDLVHILLDDRGHGIIIGIGGLPRLEEDIRILRGASLHRMIRVESILSEGINGVPVHHVLQVLVIPLLDLLNLMGGPEAVEEIDKGKASLQRRKMRDRSQIHNLLNGGLAEHRSTGLTTCHDIGVISENGERVTCDGTGRNIEDTGQLLSRDLVDVRNHQKKTLRRGEGGGQSSGRQSPMHGAGRTGLGLHLRHRNRLPEDVLSALGRPLIDMLRHDG